MNETTKPSVAEIRVRVLPDGWHVMQLVVNVPPNAHPNEVQLLLWNETLGDYEELTYRRVVIHKVPV